VEAVSLSGLSRSLTVNLMLFASAVAVAATIVGLVTLWPHGSVARPRSITTQRTLAAKVVSVVRTRCAIAGAAGCRTVRAKLTEGPDRGTTTALLIAGTTGFGSLAAGDRIRVFKTPAPPPGVVAAPVAPYSFADFDRRLPMLWLGIGFAVLLLATGRLNGLRALVGLVASLLIVIEFLIPAILHGHSAVGVAVVGSFAVMLVTMPLCYGFGAKAIAAWLGTGISLLLAVGLAEAFTHLAHLAGTSSEEALYLSASTRISLQGLLLAGMVVGALGVLVDLTVSQASTVIALRRANPALGFKRLFTGALGVGHDHIAATVNTLVFAYAGASLPVLLIFSIGGTTFTDAINSESVAEEVVATLVGSIGLIASMPITTAIAAALALRLRDRALGEVHAHAH
jgi:uncharacterized membrane protein